MNLGKRGGGGTSGRTPGAAPAPGSSRVARPGQSSWQRGEVPGRAGLQWSSGGEQFSVRPAEGRYSPVSLSAPVPLLLSVPAAASDPAQRCSCGTKPPRRSALFPLRPFHNKRPPIRYFPRGSFLFSADSLDTSEHIIQHDIFDILDIILSAFATTRSLFFIIAIHLFSCDICTVILSMCHNATLSDCILYIFYALTIKHYLPIYL